MSRDEAIGRVVIGTLTRQGLVFGTVETRARLWEALPPVMRIADERDSPTVMTQRSCMRAVEALLARGAAALE